MLVIEKTALMVARKFDASNFFACKRKTSGGPLVDVDVASTPLSAPRTQSDHPCDPCREKPRMRRIVATKTTDPTNSLKNDSSTTMNTPRPNGMPAYAAMLSRRAICHDVCLRSMNACVVEENAPTNVAITTASRGLMKTDIRGTARRAKPNPEMLCAVAAKNTTQATQMNSYSSTLIQQRFNSFAEHDCMSFYLLNRMKRRE